MRRLWQASCAHDGLSSRRAEGRFMTAYAGGWVRAVSYAAVAALAICGALFTLTVAAGGVTSGSRHVMAAVTDGGLTTPTANVPPSSSTWLAAIDSARAGEGVGAMPVSLSALKALPVPEQIFVLTNLERTGRGLAPIAAMTAQLDGYSETGANLGEDPVVPTGASLAGAGPIAQWASNWIGGSTTALAADYRWMYQDGYGSGNLACPTPSAPGCWAHRRNILLHSLHCSTGAPTYYMGAADNASVSQGSLAELLAGTCASHAPSDETITWAEALAAAEPPAPPPTSFNTYIRIYGATPDATAAAELEHQFPATGGECPGTTGTRAVILATDASYPDALASAYLARYLNTGTLLTPPTSLSSAALAAIHEEGITKVYVVGGSFAISTAVVDQLESTDADICGGGTATPKSIVVTRIAGSTQYDTAEKIAEIPPASNVGAASFSGAYAGTNSAGGAGRYNDTAGLASAEPSGTAPLPTAIVATGKGYQDAEAASTMAYAERFPILLTTPTTLASQASSAIGALGIKQVIVIGGPYAVANSVVNSLEHLGVPVLRIAGLTYSGTSTELADFETASGGGGLGWTGTGSVTVARGNGFTDGLAGAVVAADGPLSGSPEPLVLTLNPTSAGSALNSFLHAAGTAGLDGVKVSHFTILGGPFAITQATINTMGADL